MSVIVRFHLPRSFAKPKTAEFWRGVRKEASAGWRRGTRARLGSERESIQVSNRVDVKSAQQNVDDPDDDQAGSRARLWIRPSLQNDIVAAAPQICR